MPPKRLEPLHFASIANGKMDEDFQNRFLKAQTTAMDLGVGVKLTLEINIAPQGQGDAYGAVKYSIAESIGKKGSKAFATLINEDGHIYADAETLAALHQEKMDLSTPQAMPTAPAANVTVFQKTGTTDE